jgi:hypothetical protein
LSTQTVKESPCANEVEVIVVTESKFDLIRPAHFAENPLEIGRNGEFRTSLNSDDGNKTGSTKERYGELKNESS